MKRKLTQKLVVYYSSLGGGMIGSSIMGLGLSWNELIGWEKGLVFMIMIVGIIFVGYGYFMVRKLR